MLCKEEKGKSQKCDNRFIGTVDYVILISTKEKTNNNNNNILTIQRRVLVLKLSLQWDVIFSTLHHYKKFCVVVNNKKANKIEGKYLVNKQSHTIKFLSSHDRHSSVFFIFFVVLDSQHISDQKGKC